MPRRRGGAGTAAAEGGNRASTDPEGVLPQPRQRLSRKTQTEVGGFSPIYRSLRLVVTRLSCNVRTISGTLSENAQINAV